MRMLFVVLLSLLLAVCGGTETSSEHPFIVHAFKVGKADSFLIEQNGEYMLIDTGEEDDGQKIVTYLQSHQITTLKALIITHFDKDHVGGADTIVNAVDIEHIYVPDYESDSKQTKQFLYAVDEAKVPLEKLTANVKNVSQSMNLAVLDITNPVFNHQSVVFDIDEGCVKPAQEM